MNEWMIAWLDEWMNEFPSFGGVDSGEVGRRGGLKRKTQDVET